jgi:hypothetical protein
MMIEHEKKKFVFADNESDYIIDLSSHPKKLFKIYLNLLSETEEFIILANIYTYVEMFNGPIWWESKDAECLLMDIKDTIKVYTPEGWIFGSDKNNQNIKGFWKKN